MPRVRFPDVQCPASPFFSDAPVQLQERQAAAPCCDPVSVGRCILPDNRRRERVRLVLVPVLHLQAHRVQERVPAAQRGVPDSVTFRVA